MLLKYFYDDILAQASYMVGCQESGDALVIDPARDIQQYLDAAEAEGVQITHVTETHIHADFVSGTRELANATGARMYLSDMGDENWKYGFADESTMLLRDGDWWMVGNVRIDVLHTPGHTPEHLTFMVTDTKTADKPMGLFTGDFLFVGDVGRPDLLEEAAGIENTREIGARQQFHSLKRLEGMGDYLQVWPGHGAGSACGKALGAVPSSTLGYEKMFNPAFQHDDEEGFVNWLLEGQPEAPRYFAQMKKVNKQGPSLVADMPEPVKLDKSTLDPILNDGYSLVIDLRNAEDYARTHLPGTINIPITDGGWLTYVGWFVDYEGSTYVIVPDDVDPNAVMKRLRSIGVDNLSCYFGEDVITGDRIRSLQRITSEDLKERSQQNGMVILDVRGASEYAGNHIAGAKHIPLGYLPQRANDELPNDKTIVTHCASGFRSQIATSILHCMGYEEVLNLSDDIDAWSKALETETA